MNEYTYVDHNRNDLVLYKCVSECLLDADRNFQASFPPGYPIPAKSSNIGVSIKKVTFK